MSNARFVPAVLKIHLGQVHEGMDGDFKKEYHTISEHNEDDAVGQWVRLAKAKGEVQSTDHVFLTLLVELHKKIDALAALIKHEEQTFLPLEFDSKICEIGFEHFKLEESLLKTDEEYYCRIEMPVFPKRQIPVFVKAVDAETAKIAMMHKKDQQDWDAYVTSRERIMIREMRND